MDEDHEKRVRAWLLENFTWWLDDAIKLLFGHDPHKDTKQLALEGNDIVVRAGVSARKDIAAGKLVAVNQKSKDDGSTNYLLERDDFVKWARENFSADGDELFIVWSEYKKGRPKVGKVSKRERNRVEWQRAVDDLYIQRFEESGGKMPTHTALCRELEKWVSGSAGTIRRYTDSRTREWIVENIAARKNPSPAT